LSPATTFNELVVWLPLHSSGTGTETSILTKKILIVVETKWDKIFKKYPLQALLDYLKIPLVTEKRECLYFEKSAMERVLLMHFMIALITHFHSASRALNIVEI
jgi:hypothetical protein